jgi:hypothetical protein
MSERAHLKSGNCSYHYGRLILRFNKRENAERAMSKITGIKYEPVVATSEPASVAVNEAGISVVFTTLKFIAKYLLP